MWLHQQIEYALTEIVEKVNSCKNSKENIFLLKFQRNICGNSRNQIVMHIKCLAHLGINLYSFFN